MSRTQSTFEGLIWFGNSDEKWSCVGRALTAAIEGKWQKGKGNTLFIRSSWPPNSRSATQVFQWVHLLPFIVLGSRQCLSKFFVTRSIFSTLFLNLTNNKLHIQFTIIIFAKCFWRDGETGLCIGGLSIMFLWGESFTLAGNMTLFYTCYFPLLEIGIINIC